MRRTKTASDSQLRICEEVVPHASKCSTCPLAIGCRLSVVVCYYNKNSGAVDFFLDKNGFSLNSAFSILLFISWTPASNQTVYDKLQHRTNSWTNVCAFFVFLVSDKWDVIDSFDRGYRQMDNYHYHSSWNRRSV